jgi:hypothetical protein
MDFNVLNRVLTDIPYVLQYEMELVQTSDFADKLLKLVFKKNLLIQNLKGLLIS